MSKLWCFLGVHQWGPWTHVMGLKVTKVYVYGREMDNGEIHHYTATCSRCGQMGHKRVALQ